MPTSEPYDDSEQYEISARFTQMLWDSTKDGGKKRARGEKPVWKVDPSHEGAIFSHIAKWKKGEKVDPDSGAHPLVHAAWRCLAIAWQETNGAKGANASPDGAQQGEELGPGEILTFRRGRGQLEEGVDSSGVKYVRRNGRWFKKDTTTEHSGYYYNKPRVV